MARPCPSCGKPVDDDAAFCLSCGAALPPAGAPAAPAAGAATGPPAAPAAGTGTPPPSPPPPPADTPPPAGGTSRRPLIVVIVVLAVLVVAALAVAAYFAFLRDSDDGKPTPSPTITSPSPTPDAIPSGSTVAVVAGPEGDTLTAIDTNGDSAILVPGDGKPLTDLQWSPDGTRIGYLKHDYHLSSETTLMVYDVTAGQEARVSFGDLSPQMVYGFAWISPTELVAAAYPSVPKQTKSNGTLYRCDVAAGTAEPLNDSSGTALQGQQPSASADGSKLTFVSFTAGGSAGSATETLELLDMASGTVKKVASAQNELRIEGYNYNAPLLSPDGTQIFTEHTGSDPGFSVTIYNTDGSTVATLPGLSWPTGAAWDPTGSNRVVFGGTIPEGNEFSGPAPPEKPVLIRVWDPQAAGTGEFVVVRALRTGPLHGFAWSPDGEWIIYTVMSPRHDYVTEDLFMMKSGGGPPRPVMKDGGYPSWAMAVMPQLSGGSSPTPAASTTY
jgi:WD40 repeat protein